MKTKKVLILLLLAGLVPVATATTYTYTNTITDWSGWSEESGTMLTHKPDFPILGSPTLTWAYGPDAYSSYAMSILSNENIAAAPNNQIFGVKIEVPGKNITSFNFTGCLANFAAAGWGVGIIDADGGLLKYNGSLLGGGQTWAASGFNTPAILLFAQNISGGTRPLNIGEGIAVGTAVITTEPLPEVVLGPSQDIAFTADVDGSTQRYILRLPSDFDPGQYHDLLIALHGHGSDRWQFATQTRDECRAARDFALAENMIFVSPDYRATTSWMGPLAEADVVQIIEDFKASYLINNVYICGASMGGSSSLTFAALHPNLVDGIAAMNGTSNHIEYENFQSYISASFGGTKEEIPYEYKKRSAEFWPERLFMPVGVTTGGLDTTVPPDSTLRLAAMLEKIGYPVNSVHQPSGGHSTTYADAMEILNFMVTTAPANGACFVEMDFDGDCQVNLVDFAEFAEHWLE